MLQTPNWVPGVHDKVPLMIGGTMPLLKPKLNTVYETVIYSVLIFISFISNCLRTHQRAPSFKKSSGGACPQTP